ncbi:helix-turn-helix domain-containing protein [Acetatifactor muris]|uniref:helix-turn-helix domain-containing protein n=1 Tax=Acetatifactor muris TaxID=879566 RepID=UPI000CD2F0F3|nr:helix-turn-helix transcriptional regulator [Acetatifactor muris]MCR2049529.1 helix-turn-helix domain-containing protein [Acetatifactor muris]
MGGGKLYLAQNLKYLREKNGETQKDIANMLFVTEMTISRYEKGECEPNLQKVVDLAFHFQITVDELIAKPIRPVQPLYIRNVRFLQTKYEISDKELALLMGLTMSQWKQCVRFGLELPIGPAERHKIADFFGLKPGELEMRDLSKEGV